MADIVDANGIEYNCCEQYMMFQKAVLFGDATSAMNIMSELDPAKQRKLGRLIKNYDEKIWEMNRLPIVIHGNYLKFTQHQKLKERLLETADKILVEASPYDLIWGVGLAKNDPLIMNINNWKGLNLLGIALMTVRSILC
jgi:hypothetical protein